jgi:hypothetical protein
VRVGPVGDAISIVADLPHPPETVEPDQRRRLIQAHEAGWERHLENLRAHLSG